VPGLKTLQELLSHPVGIFLPGRGIRSLCQTEGHQRPRHRSAGLTTAGHPAAEGRGKFKRLALVHAKLRRKSHKNGLRTVEILVETGDGNFGWSSHVTRSLG